MSTRINLEPAFVLHTRPFRDTSLLTNVFSRNHGHLMLLARGARSQKSPLRALLLPFTPLLLSWVGKTDLPIISKAEIADQQYNLQGRAILNGLYLNELLVRLLHRHDPHPELFSHYQNTLTSLKSPLQITKSLRLFEKNLLMHLGYGLQLNKETNGNAVDASNYYHFSYSVGLQKINNYELQQFNQRALQNNIFQGKSLLALHQNQLDEIQTLKDAERILQVALQELLGTKKLKSTELIVNGVIE